MADGDEAVSAGGDDSSAVRVERLQKVIAAAGLMSRRAAEILISAGRITVDGRVAVLGDRVDPSHQRVEVDGVPIPVAPQHVTYLLYKPLGVISTSSDPEGRRIAVDLVPSVPRVVTVGRLDADSEGLLLLSNDGDLIQRVTHPRYGMPKTYIVEVKGRPAKSTLGKLTAGLMLDDGPARAISARLQTSTGELSLIRVVIAEGRNREVRRMFETIGYPVTRLVRTAIGPLTDRSLRPGQWRRLSPQEIAALYRWAETSDSDRNLSR